MSGVQITLCEFHKRLCKLTICDTAYNKKNKADIKKKEKK